MGIGQNGVIDKPLREGGIVAIYYLGATIGGLWGGHIADKYGRVKGVLLGCFFVLLGAPLMVSNHYISSFRSDELISSQASAKNAAWMCCARVIAGLGVGFFITIIPVWSAEISSADKRGSVFSWVLVANCEY
jgi:MFS family permease